MIAWRIAAAVFGTFILTSPLNGEVLNVDYNRELPVENVIETKEVVSSNDASILFTGDVMLGRYVETLMRKNGENYPFELVRERLDMADAALINLEGPVLRTEKHRQTPDFTTVFSFDESVLNVLKNNSIDILNLSNNHTLDKGQEVFEEMISMIELNELEWFGHPRLWEDRYVNSVEINGFIFTFIGFHQATNPGFNIDAARSFIQTWRKDNPRDIIVSNVHHGPEYRKESSNLQKQIARGLIDGGSDIVIGHHPHVVQEMEIYNGKPIFYSLGNFVFDQYFSKDVQEGLTIEMVAKNIDKEVWLGVKLLPIKSKMSQPYFLENEEKAGWINDFLNRSKIDNQTLIDQGDIVYGWKSRSSQ